MGGDPRLRLSGMTLWILSGMTEMEKNSENDGSINKKLKSFADAEFPAGAFKFITFDIGSSFIVDKINSRC